MRRGFVAHLLPRLHVEVRVGHDAQIVHGLQRRVPAAGKVVHKGRAHGYDDDALPTVQLAQKPHGVVGGAHARVGGLQVGSAPDARAVEEAGDEAPLGEIIGEDPGRGEGAPPLGG